MDETTTDRQPSYSVGYEFLYNDRWWRVTDVIANEHYEGGYVYLATCDGTRGVMFEMREMRVNVVTKTARLIAQANALPGQQAVVVALSAEELVVLRDALAHAYADYKLYDKDEREEFGALYDKLAGGKDAE
jgi:hypothetical protein